MSAVTPLIRTPDGRQVRLSKLHPARYSDLHIELFGRLLADEVARLGRPIHVLDPMAGVGSIHRLASPMVWTTASELERPFVDVARQLFPGRLSVQGDAASLTLPDASFDAVVVSPDYGSRLADAQHAKDPCRCRKTVGSDLVSPTADRHCKVCDGSGLSFRQSYTHAIRRLTGDPSYQLDPRSSARHYAWTKKGAPYWTRQEAYWREALRVLRPGGLMVVDVKDVVRNKRIVPVVDNHKAVLEHVGFEPQGEALIHAEGLRFGSNAELRVDACVVLLNRKTVAA